MVSSSRVYEDSLDFGMALQFAHERGDFGKVWTRPDNIDDFQAMPHGWLFSTAHAVYHPRYVRPGAAYSPFAPRKHCFNARTFESGGKLRKIRVYPQWADFALGVPRKAGPPARSERFLEDA